MAVRDLARANDESGERLPAVKKSEVVEIGRGGAETTTERIRRLQWEASVLAAEQVDQFGADLVALAARAAEIADGGEAYPVGVRELAERIAEDLPIKAKSLLTIQHRVGPGGA